MNIFNDRTSAIVQIIHANRFCLTTVTTFRCTLALWLLFGWSRTLTWLMVTHRPPTRRIETTAVKVNRFVSKDTSESANGHEIHSPRRWYKISVIKAQMADSLWQTCRTIDGHSTMANYRNCYVSQEKWIARRGQSWKMVCLLVGLFLNNLNWLFEK